MNSNDVDLSAFAKQLDGSYQIIDMRKPQIGHGFSWGRYGVNTKTARFGDLPIFAYREP